MSNFLTKFNTKVTDPLGFINQIGDKWGMHKVTDLYRQGPLGNAGGIKAAAGSKFGSLLSGRAILQGGPQEQNMESARTFDVFGSPATAGTNQQTTARAGALAYSAAAALGALGAGSLFGGGAGGTTGGMSGSGGVLGGSGMTGTITTGPGYGGATSATAAPTATTSSPAWMQYARMGTQAMNSSSNNPQSGGGGARPMQHQYVGQMPRNPYLQGFPWNG